MSFGEFREFQRVSGSFREFQGVSEKVGGVSASLKELLGM